MFDSRYPEIEQSGYRYVDRAGAPSGRTVLLLHGMIGGPGNWDDAVDAVVQSGFRAVVPRLPVFDLPRAQSTIPGLADWVLEFMNHLGVERPVLAGNSLGGHVAATLALAHADRVGALVLVGSSGVLEMDLGINTLRRNDRDFIRNRAQLTFFDPSHVTEPLIDAIIQTINDRASALRLIRLARSAKKETITDRLGEIRVPTLVVWGREDYITPPEVADTIGRLVPDARLHWLDQCGHAPMMEHPGRFNAIMGQFLTSLDGTVA